MFKSDKTKKTVATLLMGTVLVASLAGCGGGQSSSSAQNQSSGASGDEQVTLRFSWWGGDARHEATIKAGSYVVQRPFVLVTKADTKLSDSAQKFFDFATSADAVEIISAAGVVAAQ